MLQSIRDWVTGWLAVIIIALLIIPFAFWGINYYFGQGGNVVAATVNGSDISLRDYQIASQRIRQQMEKSGTDTADKDELLKKRTLDTLINQKLLAQFKDDLNLRVSDKQVRQTIQGIRVFRGDNGFDSSLYTRYLANAGYTPASFEAQIRQDMTSEQLQAGILESSFVTSEAVEQIAKLNNQTRDIAYTLVPYDRIVKKVQVTNDEIKKYYDSHDQEFMEPEKVRVAYIDLSRDEIAKRVKVNEDDLKSFYKNHKENYSVAQQRKVNQVLVSVTGKKPSKATLKKAEALAEQFRKELESGKSVEDIAKEKQSGKDGISVDVSQFGYLAKGILDKKVDSVVFSLKKGEVGGPVRTDNSYHVVQVTDVRGGETSSFADVRDQVEKDYRIDVAEKKFYDLADKLSNLTFEHPDTLEVAAEEMHLPVQKSDYFSRKGTGDGLFKDPKVLTAAFSDDVLQEGNNSQVIQLNPNRDVVLRDIDHKPTHKKSLAEVRDDIVKKIRFQKGSSRAEEIGKAIIKGLKQGQSKDALSDKYGVKWKTGNSVKRDEPTVNRTVLRTAFSLGHPAAGKSVYGGTSMGSGDYAVVQVKAVHDAGTVSHEDVAPVRKKLRRKYAVAAWTQFLDNLRSSADITIHQGNL